MEKKLRQVTDSIHGTIYLSEMESDLISTPYFYRLHDIYQSSTVYMTFPNNRTKRYEHSLGTMALASKMLFSSVTNADKHTRDVLFSKLKDYFVQIVNMVNDDESCVGLYFNGCKEEIEELFDTTISAYEDKVFIDCIKYSIKSGEFIDNALDYYQYYPMECITNDDNNNLENIFLYRCLLQAVRIVALFHDVGHPPYSHIIEEVLIELYNMVDSDSSYKWEQQKINELKKCLGPFLTKEQQKAFCCKRLFSKSSLMEAQPHERIGLGLLSYAVNDVIPEKIIKMLHSKSSNITKLSHILYYITVVEFVFAILTEKDNFFKSFHKIVDGIIDSDRLDYIVRDSKNSGVDWGEIPYERIINSAKLLYLENNNSGEKLSDEEKAFVIAYPQKISDDIEDLILVRYKIFARINFHHRCMKTSMALQAAVRDLAINYLTNADDKCINPDISILWTALNTKMGNKRIRTIQWNDSWLISVLHKSLVTLYSQRKNQTALKENLEEILLNKKKYYSLMKRGRDNCSFVENVLLKAGITREKVEKIKEDEYEKFYCNNKSAGVYDIFSDPKSEALDSIGRLCDIFENLDLESLCKLIPLDGDSLKNIIELSLKNSKKSANHAVIINKGRTKTGLPKHEDVLDGIYLYNGNQYLIYDEIFSLQNQVNAITKNIPWLYIYFIPNEKTAINELRSELIETLSVAIAEKLKSRFNELFTSSALSA